MYLHNLYRQYSSLLFILATLELTTATLYRTGSDVTITCSSQTKNINGKDNLFEPSLDVGLASSGGIGEREINSPRGTDGRTDSCRQKQ